MITRMDRAIVVFSPYTNLWYLRALKQGFRHCFIIMGDTVIDPMAGGIETLKLDDPPSFLAECRRRGMTLVRCRASAPPSGLRLGLISCVSITARILGLKRRFLTPYSLYRYLIECYKP
ncbi:MAG: hypothetical protein LBL52_00785 [Rickettsiales bacterium]|jgi:hypothetical protein|nr:hypothetical protein [Rickettsiales bacterium]